MGSFFTNVHVRIPDGVDAATATTRLRAVVERTLRADGLVVVDDGPVDREVIAVVGPRWIAFYDRRAEDQDDTIETWAKDLSGVFETHAVSVLVHDSDVLALTLFANGTQRDAFDSNPRFSGKHPSKTTPAERADKWLAILAPGHAASELAAVFAAKQLFAEKALEPFADAIGADIYRLATGYRYLTTADELPPGAIRIAARYAARPAWEQRASGAPRFSSVWESEPPQPHVVQLLVGQSLHASTSAKNRGGAATGMRVEIVCAEDSVELDRVEVVIRHRGRLEMDRHMAVLVRDGNRYVAEVADAALQPGPVAATFTGSTIEAMMDANNAGTVHLNIHGTTLRVGEASLAVTFVPLANPLAAHVEHVPLLVSAPRGVPLRAKGELYPHILEPLVGDDHTYALVLVEQDRAKDHALALIEALRFASPKGKWVVFPSMDRATRAEPIRVTGALRDTKVWEVVAGAIRDSRHVSATCDFGATTTGFEMDLHGELAAISISARATTIGHEAAARLLVPAIDGIGDSLVQALLARWSIRMTTTTTPYEHALHMHDNGTLARRAWATRYLRGVGRGFLWFGAALRERAGIAETRVAVEDVAATEQRFADLLPSSDDFQRFER